MSEIFVFGSNLAGRHGLGAAKHALIYHGAIYGQGVGRQGNSYAIPTKDSELKVLPLEEIDKYVKEFMQYAREHKELTFILTRVGCGLAGYNDHQMSSLFWATPHNVIKPAGWNLP